MNTTQDEGMDLSGLLRQINGGKFVTSTTGKINHLVETLQRVAGESGKAKGKVTLGISITLDRGIIEIVADAKVQEPATVTGRTMLWATTEGQLVTSDPRQHELSLAAGEVARDATPDVGKVRDIRERQASSGRES